MPYRRVVALLLATTALVALSACTTGSPDGGSVAVAKPQPDIAGEWVVTRTVASSNDPSNPAHAVGTQSVRYVLVDRDDCGEPLCAGTVESGATVEARESTTLTQTDGGLTYTFTGGLDCLNATTGAVVAVDGFNFSQTATLTTGPADATAAATASALAGTLSYTDTVTEKAAANGCVRDPATVTVEYTVSAVRAP